MTSEQSIIDLTIAARRTWLDTFIAAARRNLPRATCRAWPANLGDVQTAVTDLRGRGVDAYSAVSPAGCESLTIVSIQSTADPAHP